MSPLSELGHDLTPFESVRETVLDLVTALQTETVRLPDAVDRVLAEDLVCRETVPSFDNSAMDGYAVRASELESASQDAPVTLPVIGTLAAGDTVDGPLAAGTTTRIMTGAPVPPGADAVVPHELTRGLDGGASDAGATAVRFSSPIPAGKNIRRAGGDMRPGDVPLRAGSRLTGPRIAAAAVLGYGELLVTRRPRIALVSPGKELVDPWETPGPGQIRNSNPYGLAGLVADCGGLTDIRKSVDDDPEIIRGAIRDAIDDEADALISTGGISAGDFDFVQQIVREDGDPGYAFKTSMRPGKPFVFGLMSGGADPGRRVPYFGLPGNPAAAIVSFTVFVRPALRKMRGETPWIPQQFGARFEREFRYKPGRVFMLRARVEPDLERGDLRIVGSGDQDSGFLAGLASANALVELPADRGVIEAGEILPAHWIHPGD